MADSVKIRITGDDSGYKTSLEGLGSVASAALGLAAAAAASVTGALTAGVTAAYKFGTAFETSLAKVSTIADTTVKSVSEINDEVLALSNDTGVAGTEINEALYQAISAGAATETAMQLVDAAVKSAKAGFTDTATAVDGLTSVLNTYQMATTDADELANKFLITQNLGKTTFDELAASIGRVAPTASSAGIPVEELLSSVAALTAQGINTAESMSGLKAAISGIIKPTDDAMKTAEALGIDFSVAALQTKGFSGFLEDLKTATGGNVETMASLFGSVEGLNAMLTLTSDGGMALMDKSLQEMETNTGILDESFEKMQDTVDTEMTKVQNTLTNLGIAAYDKFRNPLKNSLSEANDAFITLQRSVSNGKLGSSLERLGVSVGKLIEKLSDFVVKWTPKLIDAGTWIITNFDKIAKVVLIAVGAFKALSIMQSISRMYQTATKDIAAYRVAQLNATAADTGATTAIGLKSVAIGVLTGKITLAEAAQWLWNAAMSANPIGIVITAVGLLTGALVLLTDTTDGLSEEERLAAERSAELTEAINERKQAYEELSAQQDEAAEKTLAELGRTEDLWKELQKLTDEKGKVKDADKEQVEFILGQLNEAFGWEFKLVGDQIEQYETLEASIYRAIDAKKAQIILDSEQAVYTEAVRERAAAEEEAAQKYVELTEQRMKVQELRNEQDRLRNQAFTEMTEAEALAHQDRTLRIIGEIEKEQAKLDEIQNDYNTAEENYLNYCEDIASYEEALTLFQQGKYEEAIAALQSKDEAFVKSTDIVDKSAEEQIRILEQQAKDTKARAELMAKWFAEGVDGISQEMVDEANETAAAAQAEFEKVGGNMTTSMASGAQSQSGILNRAMGGIVSGALLSAKRAAGIASPSKEGRAIGKNIAESIGMGGKEGEKAAVADMEDVMDAILSVGEQGFDMSSLPPNFFGYGKTSAEQFVAGFRTAIAAAKGVMSAVVSDAVPKAAFVNQQTARPNLSDIVELAGAGGVKTVVVKAELRGQPVLDFIIDGLNGRAKVTGASLVEV